MCVCVLNWTGYVCACVYTYVFSIFVFICVCTHVFVFLWVSMYVWGINSSASVHLVF